MEEKKTTRTMLPVYVITHYGEHDKDCMPFFLKSNGCFTSNENSQYIMRFESPIDADASRENIDKRLEKIGHPIAGKLHVMQLGLVEVDVQALKGDNGES